MKGFRGIGLGLWFVAGVSTVSFAGGTPDPAGALVNMVNQGRALFESGKRNEARALYDQVLARGCLWAFVYEDIGLMEYDQGHLEAAEEALKQAAELNPFSMYAPYYLALIASTRQDTAGFEHWGRRFCALAPDQNAAATFASQLHLSRSDGLWLRADEIPAVQQEIAWWKAHPTTVSWKLPSPASAGAEFEAELHFDGIILWDNVPCARFTVTEGFTPTGGERIVASYVDVLIGPKGQIPAVAYEGAVWFGQHQFRFRTVHEMAPGRIWTVSRSVGQMGKDWISETFRFSYSPGDELNVRQLAGLWGKIPVSQRARFDALLASGELPCIVDGWNMDLGFIISGLTLARLQRPGEKGATYFFAWMLLPHAGLTDVSPTFRRWTQYASPFWFDQQRITSYRTTFKSPAAKKGAAKVSVPVDQIRMNGFNYQIDDGNVVRHID